MNKHERVFSILNKFDRVWSGTKGKITFCQIVNLVTNKEDLTDVEFTQAMDKYIEINNIK